MCQCWSRGGQDDDLLELEIRWEPLSRVLAAVLDRRVTQLLAHWPEIGAPPQRLAAEALASPA